MEKLLTYSLSIFLFITAGCHQKQGIRFDHLSDEEKSAKLQELDSIKNYYYQGSRIKQALFDTLMVLDPLNADYLQEKSVTHSKIGDYHVAIPLLEKAEELNPSETLYYYSWLMTNLYKDYEKALIKLQKYDDLTPEEVDYAWGENVNFLKGKMHQQLKQYDQALQEYDYYISSEGEENVDIYVFVYRGITHMENGRYKDALADFEKMLTLYDKSSMAYYYKGITHLQLADTASALEALLHAKTLLEKGYKKTDPYKEVYNEVHLMQVEDKLAELD
ncbi:Tetratricopeptide repeat family protein [Fulvivirga imtechensis AK7]|uniref:Tetratricopeptide repeat family protein n=1 Tax=Fulvivirga imtechensis AK7 TaxID=1237149 RepID=L8JZW3_9BACT|nr:tetratricopeptide repeat protein [Fulvivirga imtechensis]ELR73229.1 Tetratricopeptide repeat family protein [Fulvivirga imtechensis AK7]